MLYFILEYSSTENCNDSLTRVLNKSSLYRSYVGKMQVNKYRNLLGRILSSMDLTTN